MKIRPRASPKPFVCAWTARLASTSVVEALGTALYSGCGEVVGRGLAGALVSHQFEADALAFRKVMHPRALCSADVDEHVVAAVFRLNEAKTLGSVKPLNSAYFHFSSLPRKRGRLAMSLASSQIIDVQKKTRLRVAAKTLSASQGLRPKLDLRNMGGNWVFFKIERAGRRLPLMGTRGVSSKIAANVLNWSPRRMIDAQYRRPRSG